MPVINPWIVYWINTANSIGELLMLFCFLSVISVIVFAFNYLYLLDMDKHPSKKSIIISSVVFVILSITTALFPDKNTLMQMAIASQVTVERVDIAKETVEKIYNDILEVIKEK